MFRSVIAIASLLAAPVFAADYEVGDLKIAEPVIFEPLTGARATAGYMTITNSGDTVERLLSVDADLPRVEVHASFERDGMRIMEELVDGLEIAPGETATLAPAGNHVMFMGLQAGDLPVDTTLPAKVVFETAGTVEIEFVVVPRDGMQSHDH